MFVVHYGFVADGCGYAGELCSTRELALSAANTMIADNLDSEAQEIVLVNHETGITASGINYEDDEAEVFVAIDEIEVDKGCFVGEIK